MGMDINGHSGNYFRAGGGSWGPICDVCEHVVSEEKLNLSFDGWRCNGGCGIKDNPLKCEQLADGIERWVARHVLEHPVLAGQMREFVWFLRTCGGGFSIW